jgi:putative methylase
VTSRRALERELAALQGFENPRVEREQYATPAPVAAHLVHLAGLHGDLTRRVVDLGTGTGVLAIGAALAGAEQVVGLDLDRAALDTARRNEERASPPVEIDWVAGDATDSPLCLDDATVLTNPPFGAQCGHEHADRAFLATVAGLATVSYSIHNAGSESFVESFAGDGGGEVTHAFRAEFSIPRQFEFHEQDVGEIEVEVYRIEWGQR